MEYRDYPNSSNVDRIAWYPSIEDFGPAVDDRPGADASVDVLTVRFKGRSSTRPYAYWSVAPQQWEQLRDCQGSIGTLIQKAIIIPTRRGEYSLAKLAGESLGEESDGAAQQEYQRDQADQKARGGAQIVDGEGNAAEIDPEAADSIQTQPVTPSTRPARRRISRLA